MSGPSFTTPPLFLFQPPVSPGYVQQSSSIPSPQLRPPTSPGNPLVPSPSPLSHSIATSHNGYSGYHTNGNHYTSKLHHPTSPNFLKRSAHSPTISFPPSPGLKNSGRIQDSTQQSRIDLKTSEHSQSSSSIPLTSKIDGTKRQVTFPHPEVSPITSNISAQNFHSHLSTLFPSSLQATLFQNISNQNLIQTQSTIPKPSPKPQASPKTEPGSAFPTHPPSLTPSPKPFLSTNKVLQQKQTKINSLAFRFTQPLPNPTNPQNSSPIPTTSISPIDQKIPVVPQKIDICLQPLAAMHSLIVTKVLTFKNKAQLTIPSILSLGQLVSHVESKWRVPTDKIRLLLHPIVTNESTVKTEESLLIKNEDSLSQPSPSPFQLTPVPTQTPNPIKPDSTNVSNSTQPSPKTEDSPAPLARSKSTMLSASSLLSHTKSVSLDTNQVLIPFYFSASDTNCLTSSLYLALFPARQISGQNATAPTIQMAYSFIPTNPATPSNATVQSDSCLSLLLPLLHSSSTKTPEISRAKTQILSPQGTPHTPCLTDTPSRTHSNRKKRRKEYEEGRDKRASGDEASDGGKNGEDTHTPLIITPSTSRARPDLFGHRSTPPLPTSPLSHHHLSPPSLISPGTSSILSPVKTTPKQFRTITDRLTTKRQIQSTKPVTVKQEDSLKGSSKDDEERIKFSFFDSDIEHSFLVGDLEELDNKEELSKQKNQKDVISDASKPLAYIDHIPNIDGQWTTISKFDHDKRKKMVKVDVPGFFPRWKADTVRLVFYLNQSFVRTIPDSKIPPPLSFVVPDQPNILSESSASLEAEGMPTEIHKQKRKKPFSFGRVTPSGSNTDDSEMDFLSGNNRRRSPVPTPFSAPIQTRKGCLASRSTKHGSTVSKSQTKNGRINFSWKSNDDSDYENSSDFTQASSSILTDTRYPSQSLRSTKSSQSGRSLPGESVLGKRGKGLTKNKANDVEKKKTRRGKKMLTEEEIAENEERNAVAKMARQIEEYFEEEKQKKKESRQPMSRVSSPTQPYSPSQSEIEAANQTINQSFQGLRRSSVPAFQSPLIQAPTSARLFSPHPPLSQSLSHFAGISSPPISLSSHHHSLIVPDIMSLHSQQASPVPTGQTNMNIPFSFSLNLFSPIKTQLTSVKKG